MIVRLLQVIVVGVGTMNMRADYMHSAEQIVGGILEIVKTCHEKQPQAEILVMVGGPSHLFNDDPSHYHNAAICHLLIKQNCQKNCHLHNLETSSSCSFGMVSNASTHFHSVLLAVKRSSMMIYGG